MSDRRRPISVDAVDHRPHVRLGRQIAIIAAAVAAYFLVRGATESAFMDALVNARKVIDFEIWLGIYHEQSLQSSLAASPSVTTVLNWIYIWGHWPVIAVTLLWLARRHPSIYLRTRNAMLVSGGIGLIVFATFPVVPPRLAGVGMIDTVTVSSEAYRVLQPAMFTNQFAAMPSLHVGWDLLIGLAIFTAASRPLLKALGVLLPVAMVVTVVLTANHYIIDAIVGATLTATCWVVVGWWQRRRSRATTATATATAPASATASAGTRLPAVVPLPVPAPVPASAPVAATEATVEPLFRPRIPRQAAGAWAHGRLTGPADHTADGELVA